LAKAKSTSAGEDLSGLVYRSSRRVQFLAIQVLEAACRRRRRRLQSACGDVLLAEFEAMFYSSPSAAPAASGLREGRSARPWLAGRGPSKGGGHYWSPDKRKGVQNGCRRPVEVQAQLPHESWCCSGSWHCRRSECNSRTRIDQQFQQYIGQCGRRLSLSDIHGWDRLLRSEWHNRRHRQFCSNERLWITSQQHIHIPCN
jgi:hypothetical protein